MEGGMTADGERFREGSKGHSLSTVLRRLGGAALLMGLALGSTAFDGVAPDAEELASPSDVARSEAAPVGRDRTLSELPFSQRRSPRVWVLRHALVIADVAACVAALLFVQFVVVRYQPRDFEIDAFLVIGLVGWVLVARALGYYDRQSTFHLQSSADDLPTILLLTTLATWLGVVALQVTHLSHPRVEVATKFWLAALVCVSVSRAAARIVVRNSPHVSERAIILGSGVVALRVAQKLGWRASGLRIVGYLDDDPLPVEDPRFTYLGQTSRLESVIRAYRIEHVLVAFSRMDVQRQVDLTRQCMELDVRVDIVPRMFEVIGAKNRVHDLEGIPLVEVKPAKLSRPARFLKRCLDLVVAGAALVVLGPFMLFASWRIRRDSPGPVLFRQERMGSGGKRFEILKFRTMVVDADQRKHEVAHMNKHTESDSPMFKIADDPRVTRFGGFLRRWSLDELPQLLNVVRGEMSLVGPRPLILDEDVNVVGRHRHRLDLLPGITGLWQVLGRSDIPFAEMVTLDYLYVTNWSLWGDVKLLLRTVSVVLHRRGAY
jgi:exopolysaccharide biosynthesis polyprenyl glycosylphosphotransferase